MAAAEEQTDFDRAVQFVRDLPADGDVQLDNAVKLQFYGWFKQATVGTCAEKGGDRPSMFYYANQQKYDAWAALGDMSADDAKAAYVAKLKEVTAGTSQEFS